jgi:hypothetical protein
LLHASPGGYLGGIHNADGGLAMDVRDLIDNWKARATSVLPEKLRPHAKSILIGSAIAIMAVLWQPLFGHGDHHTATVAVTAPMTAATGVSAPAGTVVVPETSTAASGGTDNLHRIIDPAASSSPPERGWVASAYLRSGDLMADHPDLSTPGTFLATWIDTGTAARATDHVLRFPAQHVVIPAGNMRQGWRASPAEVDRYLFVQLAPPPVYDLKTGKLSVANDTEYGQVCSVQLYVDWNLVIDERSVLLMPGSPDAGLVATKKPVHLTTADHLYAWWWQCEPVSRATWALRIPGKNDQFTFSPSTDVSIYADATASPATRAGVEASLWEGDANGRRIIRGQDVVHAREDDPKYDGVGVVTLPSVGSGAVEKGYKLGWYVEALPYGEDYRVDAAGTQPAYRFMTDPAKPNMFGDRDYARANADKLRDAEIGPYVYVAHATIHVPEGGHWQYGTVVLPVGNRNTPEPLMCSTTLSFNGNVVAEGEAQVFHSGGGVVVGGSDFAPGDYDAVLRLACKAPSKRGWNVRHPGEYMLRDNGAFSSDEPEIRWSLIAMGPHDDRFRFFAKDEAFQSPTSAATTPARISHDSVQVPGAVADQPTEAHGPAIMDLKTDAQQQ